MELNPAFALCHVESHTKDGSKFKLLASLTLLYPSPLNTSLQSIAMALRLLTLALAFSIVFTSTKAKIAPSPSYYSVKSSVFCVDCSHTYNYTGIRVLITCDQLKKPIMAMTKTDGSFEAKLALGNCLARLLGGPKQLYAPQTNIVSNLIKVGNDKGDDYTTSTSLTFASKCSTLRKFGKCGEEFGSSKTVDLNVPPEYGLPPTRYYMPVFPIIGIP